MMAKLVEENNGLIWSIVRRFKDRGYELEDLYQIGSIGFIKSIKRFDTSFDVKLSTYAVPYILGEIKRFIRDDR
jgi:RNA polymerase sporulation-specific sigma factor